MHVKSPYNTKILRKTRTNTYMCIHSHVHIHACTQILAYNPRSFYTVLNATHTHTHTHTHINYRIPTNITGLHTVTHTLEMGAGRSRSCTALMNYPWPWPWQWPWPWPWPWHINICKIHAGSPTSLNNFYITILLFIPTEANEHSRYVNMCIHVCVCVRMYVCICTYVCIYVYSDALTEANEHSRCVCVYAFHVNMSVYVCICLCMYVCICAWYVCRHHNRNRLTKTQKHNDRDHHMYANSYI